MISRKNSVAAFIDMDYTLTKIFLYQALFAHHKQHRFKRLAVVRFVAFHFPLWVLVKAGLLSKDYFYRINAANLAWLVKGVPIERADAIWDWVIDHEILPNLRPEVVGAIDKHKSEGHRIILISGSFTPLLENLAQHLEFESAIATPLAEKNGRYTGRIIPPINVGQGKLERLHQFLKGPGKNISLAESYFYTDSIVDAPVLEIVGHPVVVYPDPELARVAAARGWPVIGDRHDDVSI
jgi:HAD superfamily hydrolase (TIGR01490 family)